MLSFLLEQICIEIDYFLLKFFENFGSVLGLQVTAGPQVTSGLQSSTIGSHLLQAQCCIALNQPKKESNR